MKRHIIVDSLGLLMAVAVTAASADDGTAPRLLRRLTAEHLSRLVVIWADQKYRDHALERWRRETKLSHEIEVVERPAGSVGCLSVGWWSGR